MVENVTVTFALWLRIYLEPSAEYHEECQGIQPVAEDSICF